MVPQFRWPQYKPGRKIKPLGATSPHVWVIEPVFGCNLSCGHCCAGLIQEADKQMMTEAVWVAASREETGAEHGQAGQAE